MNTAAFLNQCAVYWYPSGTDRYGQTEFGDPVEISVRWQDLQEEFLDKQGDTQLSRAVVYSDQSLSLEGFIFLGDLADLSSAEEGDPQSKLGAYPIRQVRTMASVDQLHKMYRYWI